MTKNPHEARVKRHIKRRDHLNSMRQGFLRTYEDLARVMLTTRSGFTTSEIPGSIRTDDIFDGTAMQDARTLANTVGAMLNPEGEVFGEIVAENPEDNEIDENAEWLSDTTARFDAAIRNPKARFSQSTGELNMDLVVFGEGIHFTKVAKSLTNLHMQTVHLRDGIPFYDEEGTLQGMYRTLKRKVWQLMEQFPEPGQLSEKVLEDIKKDKLDKVYELLHVVTPRKKLKFKDPIRAINMPYEDLWMELESCHIMKEGGFHEMPFIAPRWDTSSGEDQGRSPAMIALPDANTSQSMGETILVAGQRVADPPLMVPDDGTWNPINTYPGALSYYDIDVAQRVGGNPFFPLISGANLPITRDMQQDTRMQISAAFFKNILNLPVNGPEMTATEIMARKDQILREMGPVFGHLDTDYKRPMGERSFNVMLRAGAFKPIPEGLIGKKVKFKFRLPVTKLREQIEAAAATQLAQEAIQVSQVFPEALDIVNIDEIIRFSADAKTLPKKLLRGREEVEEIRKARSEAAQAQQQMQNMNAEAEIGQKAMDAGQKLNQMLTSGSGGADGN
jgi:hypothetical protein